MTRFPKYFKLVKKSKVQTMYSLDTAIIHHGNLVCMNKSMLVITPIENIFKEGNFVEAEGKAFNHDALRIMSGCDCDMMEFHGDYFLVNKNGVEIRLQYSDRIESSGDDGIFLGSGKKIPDYRSLVDIKSKAKSKKPAPNKFKLSHNLMSLVADCVLDRSGILFNMIEADGAPIHLSTELERVLIQPIFMEEKK